ncbi:LANO_0G01002g1_1 [Lachancea nothofagi CBS 11611]|uniref:Phosphotransferase n=1 Tax=Lachancea nothofagi CBS 11611 TaxID=1266666 RepID=A0A1G4KEJ7_9SACH|nr:LANO_0G01002g1_1 [Lachancea nothofagi CBS 11611]
MSFDKVHQEKQQLLCKAVDQICQDFTLTSEKLHELTHFFVESMEKGLGQTKEDAEYRGLPMIPTFVTGKPNGTESGMLLAADLGGTNFRVCSVDLKGNHEFALQQMKSKIPEELLEDESVTSDELFGYLARRTLAFVNKYHPEYLQNGERLRLGFTFSYPVEQTSLSSGTLIRWTKGFKIKDTLGKDVVQLYQKHLEAQGMSMIRVVALANDTVGTFLSHCYCSENNGSLTSGEIVEPVMGCIFGTGTNGAYMEEIENIQKLPEEQRAQLLQAGKTHMCINTEWGSFDNDLKHLPTTRYDIDIDQKFSSNPGFHLFEKRVSGMFLGEILRNVLVDLYERGAVFTQYTSEDKLPHRLRTPFELSSEVLSHIEIDDSSQLRETELSILQSMRLPTTYEERIEIQKLVRAISRRSAYLAAVPIAAILMKTGALNKRYHGEVEIGCDGSVVEYYPGFRSMIRHALSLSPIGPEGERKTHLCIAKDGSGVGAALCALVA